MFRIPPSKQRGANDSNPRPAQVQIHCPSCQDLQSFRTRGWSNEAGNQISWVKASCFNCDQRLTFLAISPTEKPISKDTGIELYAHPGRGHVRKPLDGLRGVEDFGDRLERDYKSALRNYNNRDWNGAVVMARRVLEGVTKQQLPEEERRQPLAGLLEALSQQVTLEEPLERLAHGIRKGGNIGAHFDEERDADEETAQLLLDLLDELLKFLLITPHHIDDLHERVSR